MKATQEMSDETPQHSLKQVQALRQFCSLYPCEQAQHMLWRWFILALKDNYDGLSSARTTDLIIFYENLKTLISAVYQIHDLSPEAAQESIAQEDDQAALAEASAEMNSIAVALDTLHTSLSHNWTLLICPPE